MVQRRAASATSRNGGIASNGEAAQPGPPDAASLADSHVAAAWSRQALSTSNGQSHAAFNRECDAACADLRLVTAFRPFTTAVPTVICVVRNEQLRLPDFLSYYKRLGVKTLHVIDNDSDDDTQKICAADDRVTLWHTASSYADAAVGQMWVGAIARKYGLGKWILNVDADELFVYPDMARYPIGMLQDWLTAKGCKRVFAPLIDMYGSRLYGRCRGADHRPMLSQNPFFDGGTFEGRAPYEFKQSPHGPLLLGGPRSRAVSAGNRMAFYLSKFPLSRWDNETSYANVHFPYPFFDNPPMPYAALQHFKFLTDFAVRVREAVADDGHWSNVGGYEDYRLYDTWVAGGHAPHSLFSEECSRLYRGPDSLIRAGLLEQIPW